MPETTDDTSTETTTDETTTTTEASTEDDLGEGGKKALEAERKAVRTAERKAKALEKEVADLKAATATDSEKAIAAARAEARTEALVEANRRVLAAEVKALAGGKLADPEDAVRLIDLDSFEVADDGTIDTKAIGAELDALVKAKPYLAAGGSSPSPLPGGGATPSEGVSIDDWIRQKAGL